MSNQTTIKCPDCQTDIDVNEILYHQLEEELNKKAQKKDQEYKKALDKLKAKEESIKEQLDSFDEELKKATAKQLRLEKQRLQDELKKEIREEQRESMALLERELAEKSDQVKELNRSRAEIARLKRENEEVESRAKAEAQQALSEELKIEKAKIAKALEKQSELKLKQKDEQLEQIKRELDNAQRKAEQGSMQLQGEVLELAIESWLSSQFPFDNIDEVKKGAFGADCVQRVHTREIQNCGVICYETKNTKAWSEGWIIKLSKI